MAARQRLVLCLDGTWNRQDSSTNVLHQFNLTLEGTVEDGIVQKKYYHKGVGTGVLDAITGGGFGFGLEANVRDGYNWLVENFCDNPGHAADQIYIFGFSRGAYTARSLVGFIGQCGLLRRGAPITVQQLWHAYCVLGRQKENRKSLWEKIIGTEGGKVRPITDLERASQTTAEEQLLLRWSRRVPIAYLGVYDTVGAIGWDALAIPGLTSRLALHNNIRPTTLIQNCRHALAIDEHRSNFNHTPFIAYLQEDSEELERAMHPGPESSRSIAQNRAMWRRKIEQRWFVGAHSNIGGGYDSNQLAQLPLHWIMQGAAEAGLRMQEVPLPESLDAGTACPRDSYAEFVPPLWDTIIRNKRNYRIIDPQFKLRARAEGQGRGFALETINERLDPSVLAYWQRGPRPIPPNLECYLKREAGANGALPYRTAQHVWLRERWFSYTALVVWTVLTTLGVYAVDRLGGFKATFDWSFAWILAAALPVIDWAESKLTFAYAVGTAGPLARALLDALYWARTLAFVLFVFGLTYGCSMVAAAGWGRDWSVFSPGWQFWVLPLIAALPAVFITKARSRVAWIALLLGPAAIVFASFLVLALASLVHALFPEAHTVAFRGSVEELPSLPGLLLLLQLAGIFFWRALAWVAEPLSEANLGSITKLQKCYTPAQVVACLDNWRNQLSNTRDANPSRKSEPAVQLLEILRHALWRDIIGFIPVYTGFLLLGLWFGKELILERRYEVSPSFLWISNIVVRFWWLLPALAASADYLEDVCHLGYCRGYEKSDKPPATSLTLFSFCMTAIKYIAFTVSVLMSVLAVVAGSYVICQNLSEWRAKIAVLLTVIGIAFVILVFIAIVAGKMRSARLELARSQQKEQSTC